MNLNKLFHLFKLATLLLFIWALATAWIQFPSAPILHRYGDESSASRIQILYNPDRIFNLDEKICVQLAETLSEQGHFVQLQTYSSSLEWDENASAIVFCSNTYNWAPDWQTQAFIETHPTLKGKMAIAITLGFGSTARSRRLLENRIVKGGMDLLASQTYWLLSSNNATQIQKSNSEIALEQIAIKSQLWSDLRFLKQKIQ